MLELPVTVGRAESFQPWLQKNFSYLQRKTLHGISTTGIIWQLQCGQLQLTEVQPMDLPADLQSPCSAAVLQRAVRE